MSDPHGYNGSFIDEEAYLRSYGLLKEEKPPKPLKISLIINSCCLGPRAHEITGSCSPTPHQVRLYALGNFLLPQYLTDPLIDEVIVVGEFTEGEGYKYVHSPSTYFSCVDALTQRQAGFEAATGDILIFMHDDHMLDFSFAKTLKGMLPFPNDVSVVVPQRRRRTFSGHNVLNNGRDQGYAGGHVVVATREACLTAPWGDVDKIHEWDKSYTARMTEAGMKIAWVDDLAVWDVELGATQGGL